MDELVEVLELNLWQRSRKGRAPDFLLGKSYENENCKCVIAQNLMLAIPCFKRLMILY